MYPIICSMYGIFTYIWLKYMINVGKYSESHGAFGYVNLSLAIQTIGEVSSAGGPNSHLQTRWV